MKTLIYVFAYSDIFAREFRIGNIHGLGVYCTHVSVLTNRHQRLSKTEALKPDCAWLWEFPSGPHMMQFLDCGKKLH